MAQRKPLTDQELWDSLRTGEMSFKMLLSKKSGRMQPDELRWLTIQLRIASQKITCVCIELERRAHGNQPQPLAP